MKKLICILLSIILSFACMLTATAAENSIIIDSFIVEDDGRCEIIGHISNNAEGAQVSVLAQTAEAIEESADVSIENTLYIDQTATGNNGTFLFEFTINGRFSEAEAVFVFGSDADTEVLSYAYTMPVLDIDFESISNNSVLYGNDVYLIGSSYLTSGYVVQSILNGGNIIFFKIGNYWYDLLNEAATSSAYLTVENAAENEDVKEFATGTYYRGDTRINLTGDGE